MPNHPPAQPLAGRGNSESGSTRSPPTLELEVPVAALGRVTFFQAGVFMCGCFSLLDFRAHEVGSLQGSCFPQLSGSFEDHFQSIPVLLV